MPLSDKILSGRGFLVWGTAVPGRLKGIEKRNRQKAKKLKNRIEKGKEDGK